MLDFLSFSTVIPLQVVLVLFVDSVNNSHRGVDIFCSFSTLHCSLGAAVFCQSRKKNSRRSHYDVNVGEKPQLRRLFLRVCHTVRTRTHAHKHAGGRVTCQRFGRKGCDVRASVIMNHLLNICWLLCFGTFTVTL